MALTVTPGTLIVASAYPDPPFDVRENGFSTGFDIELMRAICAQLGLTLQPVRYTGDDFNGIFDGLAKTQLGRGVFGNDDYAGALRRRAVLAALHGIQPGRRLKVIHHADRQDADPSLF